MGGGGSKSNCVECDCDELADRARDLVLNENGIVKKVKNYVDNSIGETIPIDSTSSQKFTSSRRDKSDIKIYTEYIEAREKLNRDREPFIGGSLKEGLECDKKKDSECPELNCKEQIDSLENDISKELQGGRLLLNSIFDRINLAFMNRGQQPPYSSGVFANLPSITSNQYSDLKNWPQANEFLLGKLNKDTISFHGKESMQNYQDLNSGFIDSAFAARYNYFKDKLNFSQDCEANANNSIDEFITNIKQELDSNNSSYNTLLNNYKSLYKLKTSISDLTSDKHKQIADIEKDINYYRKDLTVDNTKASYKTDNLTFNQSIKYFLLILYYFAFVVYLILSKFIRDKLYENKKIVFLLFLYLISPFIIGYILNGIVSLYIYIIEYLNIKGDILSYNDIVNNSNIT